jgi:site-specific DNA-adenine methylase
MTFFGQKRRKLYDEFISQYIPDNIETYVEPFAGSFAVAYYLFEERIEDGTEPKRFIYNDINKYDFTVFADKVHHLDYKEIFKMYDNENTVFYLDPPYYVKGNDLYQCGFTKEDHSRLSNVVKDLKGEWVLSYDDCEEIRSIYNWARTEKIDVNYSIGGATTKSELLIYDLKSK